MKKLLAKIFNPTVRIVGFVVLGIYLVTSSWHPEVMSDGIDPISPLPMAVGFGLIVLAWLTYRSNFQNQHATDSK